MREVTRAGVRWSVDAPPIGFDFWNAWENGWEQPTLDAVDRFCGPHGTFVDIGAWIGPVSMWAARRGPVLAVEPDPIACLYHRRNCEANGARVRLLRGAITPETGTAQIEPHEQGWGSSMSRLGAGGLTVRAWCLRDLLRASPEVSLVKMDIEGAEVSVLEDVGPYLAERGIPLLLALHEPWWSRPFEADWLSGFPSVEGDLTGWGQVLCC